LHVFVDLPYLSLKHLVRHRFSRIGQCQAYSAIPFLNELRVITDWTVTETSMNLSFPGMACVGGGRTDRASKK
jgi:hypothetical protein